jgi:hypothetical protein
MAGKRARKTHHVSEDTERTRTELKADKIIAIDRKMG